jgi:three-Cys-motif partner protein
MTRHAFGGRWTEHKLRVLQDYLRFYTRALKDKFKLVYVDTFAGTGTCTIRVGQQGERTIEGSARIAVDVVPPFDRFFFIERREKHVLALEELKKAHRLGERIAITQGDANKHLASILESVDWTRARGVLFLDPYGLQCDWEMVQAVAATRALDTFFLVSIAGLARQAARSASRIDAGKQAALDRFLGTSEWRTALYRTPDQDDLFDSSPALQRDGGPEAIIQFVQQRLAKAFAHVADPCILRGPNNAVLFALFIAISNPNQRARDLAARVGREILNKTR